MAVMPELGASQLFVLTSEPGRSAVHVDVRAGSRLFGGDVIVRAPAVVGDVRDDDVCLIVYFPICTVRGREGLFLHTRTLSKLIQ